MSDKKIIIRNCPCYNNERFLEGFLEDKDTFCTYYGKNCQDCTDCVMKHIVEKCKLFQNNYLVNDGVELLTTNILNSLDIQEVE